MNFDEESIACQLGILFQALAHRAKYAIFCTKFFLIPTTAILFLFLLQVHQTIGQNYHASTRSITQVDGLSSYTVLSLLAEEDGMWIGTQDGLNFFNGYDWQYWSKEGGHFQHSPVNFLLKDQAGVLWMFHTKNFNSKDEVLSIDLLLPSRDSLFSVYKKPGAPLPFKVEEIQHFFGGPDDQLYFRTSNQLWSYTQAAQFQKVKIPFGFQAQHIFPDSTLVGKWQEKLALVLPNGEVINNLDYPLKGKTFQVLGDRDYFWVSQIAMPCKVFERQEGTSTYTDKLFVFQRHKLSAFYFLHYNPEREEFWIDKRDTLYLMDKQENILYQTTTNAREIEWDRDGNYWLGKYEIEVLRLQKQKFRQFLYNRQPVNAFDKNYQCRGIFEKAGQLFVGTYNRVRQINLKNGHVSRPATGQDNYFTIIENQRGQLWLAYKNLIELDSTGQILRKQYSIENRLIWSLFEDRNGLLWLGTSEGLYCLKNEKIQPFDGYNEYPALKEALVLFFYEDKEGVIWVGSNEGLFQLDLEKGITKAYGKNRVGAELLPSKKFQHMLQDDEGIYWLATEDAGLIRWDKAAGNIKQYDKTCGLLTNNIYSVYEDEYGYLWMSSFNGLIRFHKATETFQFFHEEDGICHDEFNRISHFQANDGQLYFGSQNGVTAFHPSDFLKDTINDPEFSLRIEHISIIGQQIHKDYWEDGTSIDLNALPSKTRIIDLELTGANLFWNGNIALHYTLERLGNAPLISSRESITSGNHIELFEMLPGDYQLKIRAVRKNGKSLGEPLIVPIRIQLPFYQTPQFWITTSILMLFAIWGFAQWRTVHLKRQKAVLEKLVTERTNQVLKNQQTIDDQAQLIKTMEHQLNQRDEQWLKQFQSIVDQRLSDPSLYLPDIIDDMNISRSAFYEKVKFLTNMTPNQYIQELRLTKAKNILEQGQVATVKEAAITVGMKEPKYFSKRFKERFGILPSAYLR